MPTRVKNDAWQLLLPLSMLKFLVDNHLVLDMN